MELQVLIIADVQEHIICFSIAVSIRGEEVLVECSIHADCCENKHSLAEFFYDRELRNVQNVLTFSPMDLHNRLCRSIGQQWLNHQLIHEESLVLRHMNGTPNADSQKVKKKFFSIKPCFEKWE